MTEARPRVSNLKVALAILAVPVLTFVGCSMVANEGRGYSGRGPWEMNALGLFLVAGVLAFYCYALAFKRGPSFQIHPDRIEHFSWKKPIYFRDIDEVVFEPAEFWAKRGERACLRLKNGSIQYIPVLFMSHGPRAFADLLKDALERYRTSQPPLS